MDIVPHVMGPSRLNHGNSQCRFCLATDLEIRYALGPHCETRALQAQEQPADNVIPFPTTQREPAK